MPKFNINRSEYEVGDNIFLFINPADMEPVDCRINVSVKIVVEGCSKNKTYAHYSKTYVHCIERLLLYYYKPNL